jgi:hypothetical protein
MRHLVVGGVLLCFKKNDWRMREPEITIKLSGIIRQGQIISGQAKKMNTETLARSAMGKLFIGK